jgi:hypothetical protein
MLAADDGPLVDLHRYVVSAPHPLPYRKETLNDGPKKERIGVVSCRILPTDFLVEPISTKRNTASHVRHGVHLLSLTRTYPLDACYPVWPSGCWLLRISLASQKANPRLLDSLNNLNIAQSC